MEFRSEQAVFCDEIGTEGFNGSESPKLTRFGAAFSFSLQVKAANLPQIYLQYFPTYLPAVSLMVTARVCH